MILEKCDTQLSGITFEDKNLFTTAERDLVQEKSMNTQLACSQNIGSFHEIHVSYRHMQVTDMHNNKRIGKLAYITLTI